MTKELYIQNTKIRYLFYLLMSGILVWFLILQAFGTNERDINEVSVLLYRVYAFILMGNFVPNMTPKIPDLQAKILRAVMFSVRHLMQMPAKNCVSNYAPIPNNTPVLSIRYIAVIRSIYGNSCSHNTVWKQSLHSSCCLQV